MDYFTIFLLLIVTKKALPPIKTRRAFDEGGKRIGIRRPTLRVSTEIIESELGTEPGFALFFIAGCFLVGHLLDLDRFVGELEAQRVRRSVIFEVCQDGDWC